MRTHPLFSTVFLLLSLWLTTYKAQAQIDIPKIPAVQTSVYDYASIFNPTQKASLENKLIHYTDSTSTQIVIITIPSLRGEDIGMLAPRWAHEWGIGQKGKDNGVLILFADQDRKIWIAPGYGVEHLLTAGQTGELVRNVFIPEFRKGDYYAGFDKGTDVMIEMLSGSYKADGARLDGGNEIGGMLCFFIMLFIFIALVISSKNKGGGSSGGRRSNAPDLWDMIILSNMGRSSGSWGSGSGGGFSGGGGFGGGFGGGGFSGGGAGGSW